MLTEYIEHEDFLFNIKFHKIHDIGHTDQEYGWTGYMEGMTYEDLPSTEHNIFSGTDKYNRRFLAIKTYKLYKHVWYPHVIVLFQRYSGNKYLIVNNGIGYDRVMNEQIYNEIAKLLKFGKCEDNKIKIYRYYSCKINDSYSDIDIIF